MKATRHCGRNSSFSVKHNDRNFDFENAEHIDANAEKGNVYWDCIRGKNTSENVNSSDNSLTSFEEVELKVYGELFSDYVNGQNGRYEARRQYDRTQSIANLYTTKRTTSEETILQVGNMDLTIDRETILRISEDYIQRFDALFGSNIKILDWTLHVDESTPHVHERHVFFYKNEYGEIQPVQERALEELGIELPRPDEPKGRKNNRKMTFDKICCTLFLDICAEHGLEIEREPEWDGRRYLQKRDYIIMRQEEKLSELSESIEEKTAELQTVEMKMSDIDGLIEGITNEIYDSVCEEITKEVQLETHKADLEVIAAYKREYFKARPNLPENAKKNHMNIFNTIENKIAKAAGIVLEKVKSILKMPEKAEPIKAKVATKAKGSLMARLTEKRAIANENNKNRSQNMNNERKKSRDLSL